MRNKTLVWPLAISALLGFACGPLPGDPFGEEGNPGAASATGETDPELVEVALAVKAGTPMMRNLSNREYLASIAALIGEPIPRALQASWTATTQFGGFDAIPWTNFDTKAVRERAEALEGILDRAVVSRKVMTCEVSGGALPPYAECAAGILEPLAARAFGRPLDADEKASLEQQYEAGVTVARTFLSDAPGLFRDGIRAALGSVFLAPQFLTRVEAPPSPEFTGERDLTPYELADRVSFMFVGELPDDELWARAEDESLTDVNVLVEQVERLLDTKTESFVHNFMGQWFDFRAYEDAPQGSVESSMWRESLMVFSDIVKGDLSATSLVKPGFTYVDAQLAGHYGLTGTFTPLMQKVETDRRGGALQQGAWLSLSATPEKTSPMHRGRLVQDRLLCKVIPPPDSALFEEIQSVAARIPADATVKERLSVHRDAGPACKGCHQFMDPIGLGLEGFDPRGRERTVYADGKPVETDSDILGKPFRTALEMNDVLVKLPEYTQCVSEKLSVYAMRTTTPNPELHQYLTHAKDRKVPGVREMVLRMVKSNAFRKVTHGPRS